MISELLFIDQISIFPNRTEIHGWALDQLNVDEKVIVNLTLADKVIATEKADHFRQDLSNLSKTGNHLFIFTLPFPIDRNGIKSLKIETLNGKSRRLNEAHVIDNSYGGVNLESLLTGKLSFKYQFLLVTQPNNSKLSGILFHKSNNKAIDTFARLKVNNNESVIHFHDIATLDFMEHGQLSLPSFEIDLTEFVQDGETEITIESSGGQQYFNKRVSPGDLYEFNVDVCETVSETHFRLAGWAYHSGFSQDTVEISIKCGKMIIPMTLSANRHRPDLLDVCGHSKCGFDETINLAMLSDKMEFELLFDGFKHSDSNVEIQDTFQQKINKRWSETREVQVYGNCGHIIGALDKVGEGQAHGWALNLDSKDTPVLLDLYINNELYTSTITRLMRGDIQRIHGGTGQSGFLFEFDPNLHLNFESLTFHVSAPGASKVEIRKNNVEHNFNHHQKLIEGNIPHPIEQLKSVEAKTVLNVSLVVVNKNGDYLLRSFFESLEHINLENVADIVIVDNGSTDESLAIVDEFKSLYPIKLVENNSHEASFSQANNLGASVASGDQLIFCNNDLIFINDIVESIGNTLKSEDIGICGGKLYDYHEFKRPYRKLVPQHIGIGIQVTKDVFKPYEIRSNVNIDALGASTQEFIAVTGALLGISKADFENVGGFDEQYFFGWEDIDLCLKVKERLQKKVVTDLNARSFHHRGTSRNNLPHHIRVRLESNWPVFYETWGKHLRQTIRNGADPYGTATTPYTVTFVVTKVSDSTPAGDYYTALELGRSLNKAYGWRIKFINKAAGADVSAADLVVFMMDDFDPRSLVGYSPKTMIVAWIRNWTDRWVKRDYFGCYHLYLASSQIQIDYIHEHTEIQAQLLPIATNYEWFANGEINPDLTSDISFTGNFWGVNRKIITDFSPAQYDGVFSVFGTGWNDHQKYKPYWKGHLAYKDVRNVYTNAKLVFDDAAFPTRKWGSVNSRVFDALAAGALVITNGQLGANELFDGLLPSYNSPHELHNLIHKYSDDQLRQSTVDQLRQIVKEKHTYDVRATEFHASVADCSNKTRIAIKIGAPFKEKEFWGDYYFAQSLKYSLEKLGYNVRIDCRETHKTGLGIIDDVVINLRGIDKLSVNKTQINILWIISHPDTISIEELEQYDHIYVASESFASNLNALTEKPIQALLQCTDQRYFNGGIVHKKTNRPLYVGNTRKIFRKGVRAMIESEIEFDLFGQGWEQFVEPRNINGTFVPNRELGKLYSAADFVINDHWDGMKENGFISNRVFDVLATGTPILTDNVVGMSQLCEDGIYYWDNGLLDESLTKIKALTKRDSQQISNNILTHHTFDNRAEVIDKSIQSSLNVPLV